MGMSWTAAMTKYFGKKPGQELASWAAELKALTPKDKEELRVMLATALATDIDPIAPPAPPVAA